MYLDNMVVHIRVTVAYDLSGQVHATADFPAPDGSMIRGSVTGVGDTPEAAVTNLMQNAGGEWGRNLEARRAAAKELAASLEAAHA